MMDSSYDSDISEDTRDLVRRGLASDRKKGSNRGELETSELGLAPIRNMNSLYVRLPHAPVVQAEEPSARGLNLIGIESVKGQNYNTYIKLIQFEPITNLTGYRNSIGLAYPNI